MRAFRTCLRAIAHPVTTDRCRTICGTFTGVFPAVTHTVTATRTTISAACDACLLLSVNARTVTGSVAADRITTAVQRATADLFCPVANSVTTIRATIFSTVRRVLFGRFAFTISTFRANATAKSIDGFGAIKVPALTTTQWILSTNTGFDHWVCTTSVLRIVNGTTAIRQTLPTIDGAATTCFVASAMKVTANTVAAICIASTFIFSCPSWCLTHTTKTVSTTATAIVATVVYILTIRKLQGRFRATNSVSAN